MTSQPPQYRRAAIISSPAISNASHTTTTTVVSNHGPISYPPTPKLGSVLPLPNNSLPQLMYQPGANDPNYTPHLPDLTGGWIKLNGMNPSDNGHKPTTLIERVPSIPFFPTAGPIGGGGGVQTGIQYPSDQIGAMQEFASRYVPKPIDPELLRYAQGWCRLPYNSPVYVAVPGFGVGVALYWRYSLLPVLAGHSPALIYAVMKLTPLPLSAITSKYVGSFYGVFATWCKPLKWCISQYPTQASVDPFNIVILSDEGQEFRVPLDAFRTFYRSDVRARCAVNALCRDFVFMEQIFAFSPSLPPMEIQLAIAQYAAQINQYQQTLGGQPVQLVNRIPGAPLNYPGAYQLKSVPPTPSGEDTTTSAEDQDDEEETPEDKPKTPKVAVVAANVNLSDSNALNIRYW